MKKAPTTEKLEKLILSALTEKEPTLFSKIEPQIALSVIELARATKQDSELISFAVRELEKKGKVTPTPQMDANGFRRYQKGGHK